MPRFFVPYGWRSSFSSPSNSFLFMGLVIKLSQPASSAFTLFSFDVNAVWAITGNPGRICFICRVAS